MPKNKVLSKPKVQIDSNRNAVDLSENSSISSLLGELECVYVQPFVKGSTGSINRTCVSRTAAVVSPAFHRVTEHFDFFMVPLHALWRPWENWKLNLNDMQDTNLVPINSTSNGPQLDLVASVPSMDFANLANSLYPVISSANDARKYNDVLRFCDELGYGDNVPLRPPVEDFHKVMNLFKIAAYQKIYFQFYRNRVYESNNPYAYNLDWLTYGNSSGQIDFTSVKGQYVARELFTRRRVNMRNDYFKNIYPGLNYVASSVTGLTGFSVPNNIGQYYILSNGQSSQVGLFGSSSGQVTVNTSGTISSSGNVRFTVQNLRAAFALDKLMRASAYAPKSVREQYKAQFGVDGHEYDTDMEATRLGSFQSSVAFQEVLNMAESADAKLGKLGAKGIGGSEKENPIKFHCEYDCIVMGIHYYTYRSRYDSFGIEPWNTHLTRSEFYQKAFENLGLRPFLASGLSWDSTTVVGWTLPNFEYKIKPDLNHGAFRQYMPQMIYENGASRVITSTTYLSTFVPHSDSSLAYIGTAEYFKVRPTDLDNVFADPVPDDHRREYFQFYCDYVISVPAVIPMSIHGQPSL